MASRTLGTILIIAGVLFYLANMGLFSGEVLLIAMGVGLVSVYFLAGHRTGFLVAGSVMTAVGLFAGLDSWLPGRDHGYLFFLMLALAFAVVYLVELATRGEGRWALYVALALGAFSALILVVEVRPPFLRGLSALWPVILIALGVWLLVGQKPGNNGDR